MPSRRSLVKLVPVIGVARWGRARAQGPARDAAARDAGTAAAPRIRKEALLAASRLIGLELADAEAAMALPAVNQNLERYEELRKIDIAPEIDPAIRFRASLPGRKPRARARKAAPARIEPPRYAAVDELAFATVPQLAALLRGGKLSPVALTKMYLDRLERYGPRLRCVVTLTADLALEQAARAEKEIRAGHYRGPLHGIPWGAKDLFATRGIRTTWGAEPYAEQRPDHDATVVERLADAGAVLVAKLSLGALAQGARWYGGVTRNPWKPDEDRTGSSGSSAGPAAAAAAGLVGFTVGTETLGSIVSPCSRCGVAGLRPTFGRVSRYGAMALSWTMDKIGPICRGVEDCALVFDALRGPDDRDLTVEDHPFVWPREPVLGKMRIGYLKNEFDDQKDRDRKAAYEAALAALRGAGARLEPIELPGFSATALRIILVAEAAAAFDDLTRNGGVARLPGQDAGDWPNTFRTARFIPAVEYIRAQRARTLLMQKMDALMDRWDVFVSPAPGSASLVVTNLTGHPAVVVPCGFVNDLPQALMFTGGLFDEEAPLRAALAFERATRWHTLHPRL
jgi:Asp-tRNA(Asn)/Glu-tRNA(Gln) amidotransferase A subunit family amidase